MTAAKGKEQHQESLKEQIDFLIDLANKNGVYDAADHFYNLKTQLAAAKDENYALRVAITDIPIQINIALARARGEELTAEHMSLIIENTNKAVSVFVDMKTRDLKKRLSEAERLLELAMEAFSNEGEILSRNLFVMQYAAYKGGKT